MYVKDVFQCHSEFRNMPGKIANHTNIYQGVLMRKNIIFFFSEFTKNEMHMATGGMRLYMNIIVSRLSRKDRGTLTVPVSGSHVKCYGSNSLYKPSKGHALWRVQQPSPNWYTVAASFLR